MAKRRRDPHRRRNIGIVAHIDAGKTTLTERMLLYTGRIRIAGEVHEGQATMDWMTDERERGITITAAATGFEWLDHLVTVIDTPGHVDFTAEVERSLRVLDGAVGVFDGKHGVEAQSETVWRQADRYGVPRVAFINKLDATGADFAAAVASIRKKLGANPVPVCIPWGEEADLRGVIDVVRGLALRFAGEDGHEVIEEPVPDDMRQAFESARDALVDAVTGCAPDAEGEALMTKYLAGETLEPEDFHAPIRAATLSGAMVPVLCGSALKNIGVQPLLNAVVAYLPAPDELPPIEGVVGMDDPTPVTRERSADAPLACLAFKIFHEKYGDLTYLRVYSGTLKVGQQLFNPRLRKVGRVGRLFTMHAERRDEVDEAQAGDIVAAVGMRFTSTGDTLCEKKTPIMLEPPAFPQTVVAMSIEPRSSAQRDKLDEVLEALVREDPTFEVRADEDTGATLIYGMGELHLEVLRSRMKREFGVEVRVGNPRVGYRESIRGKGRGAVKLERQLGGRVHFGHVEVEVEPDPTAISGPKIDIGVADAEIPRAFHGAVREGAAAGTATGPLGAYPMIYMHVRVVGGSTHESDATETGFAMAAREAVQAAIEDAGPELLEPIMRFEINVPEESLGDVLNELNTRRGDIGDIEHVHGQRVVHGTFPLSESFGFAGDLRSLSQGRGSCTLEPDSFAVVPEQTARRVLGLGDAE